MPRLGRRRAALNGTAQAYLSVRDPVGEGEPIDAEDKDAVFIGLHPIDKRTSRRFGSRKGRVVLTPLADVGGVRLR